MKRVLSLLLTLALICAVSLAGAENEYINRFLIDLFNSVGGTDLDTQALSFSTPNSDGSITVQRKDGLFDLRLNIPGYSGPYRYAVQADDKGVWFYDAVQNNGFYTTFADLDEILIEVSGETDGRPNLTLERLVSLVTKHYSGVSALGTTQSYTSGSIVNALLPALLSGSPLGELQPTVATANGFTSITYTLESSPKAGLESGFAAIDALVADPESLETMILYGHALGSDLLRPVAYTTADDFDRIIRQAFGMDESEAVTVQTVQAAWAANRESLHQKAIDSYNTAAADPEYGYQLQRTTTITLTLSLDSKSGFDSLVLRATTNSFEREMDYSTWTYVGDPKPRTEVNTIEIAYEGKDLIVKYDDTTIGKVTANKEGEIIIYSIYNGSQTETARLQLDKNEAYWTLTALDGSGNTVVTVKTGRQSASVQPLSAYESAMQKIDLAYLRELINQAAPAEPAADSAVEAVAEPAEAAAEYAIEPAAEAVTYAEETVTEPAGEAVMDAVEEAAWPDY